MSANLQMLAERGKITALDVENLRDNITPGDKFDLSFSQSLIETLLAVDLVAQSTCNEWVAFLKDALVNFLQMGSASLRREKADWFQRTISRHGLVDDHERFDLLVHVIGNVEDVPEKLGLLALIQVLEGIVNEKGPLAHLKSCDRNIISRSDVDIIQRIVVGAGDPNDWSVSQAEISVLFDLNEQTLPHANHASWQAFFTTALARFVLRGKVTDHGDNSGSEKRPTDVDAMIDECISTLRAVGSGRESRRDVPVSECSEKDSSANWVIDRFKCNRTFDEDTDALMAYVAKVASGARAHNHATL